MGFRQISFSLLILRWRPFVRGQEATTAWRRPASLCRSNCQLRSYRMIGISSPCIGYSFHCSRYLQLSKEKKEKKEKKKKERKTYKSGKERGEKVSGNKPTTIREDSLSRNKIPIGTMPLRHRNKTLNWCL